MGTGESRSLEALPLRSATGAGKYVGTILLLAACYFGTARVGLTFAIPPGNATAVWPSSGIALGAVWLLGLRFWPGVWLGATVVNLTTGVSPGTAIALGIGNTLECLLAFCYLIVFWWHLRSGDLPMRYSSSRLPQYRVLWLPASVPVCCY